MEQATADHGPAARPRVPAQAGPVADRSGPTAERTAPGTDREERAAPGTAAAGPRPEAVPPVVRPQRHSVRAQILAALRQSLLAGDLTPGEVYSAPALAGRYGVSATPVREAMQQLAGEGAVEVVPNRGFRVAEHSIRDLTEVAEVRAMLEVPAVVRLAGAVLGPERWEGLRTLAADGVAAAACGDRPGYAEADRAFHHALMSLTGNRRLAAVVDDLLRRARRPAGGPRPRPADLQADAAQHVALVDALAAGEVARAERLARDHLSLARHRS
ncbi:GntR family transcriptional regulator [Streptomyces catenulae]|uniref:GntR family transcriptional regulator n=1 Tax=Streptomyces catenulae TaxID=66875 RepID=A0ABV2YYQ1_9ACTN|nr:GntR family transcriptional regulator [Streptomyces catenulae]